jgi:hypothetical protein
MQVILNGVDFFGHSQQFLKALRRVVDLLATSPLHTGKQSARYTASQFFMICSETPADPRLAVFASLK